MPKRQTAAVAGALTIGGVEYVVIPKAEYHRLRSEPAPVEAHAFVRSSLGADLRAAREVANLTQAELAARLKKSQTLISQAEAGNTRVSERYVRAVLEACGLPADWSGPKKATPPSVAAVSRPAASRARSAQARPH